MTFRKVAVTPSATADGSDNSVGRKILDHQDLNKFGELIATNRGVRVAVFDTVRETEKWLLAN